jgi:hypothetical protein
MCRNIKRLRFPDRRPTDDELQRAALQYVRKVSGFRSPSKLNEDVFQSAVLEVAEATRKLMDSLVVRGARSTTPTVKT